MSHARIRVLLVEDNPGDERLIRELLLEATHHSLPDCRIDSAITLADAIDHLAAHGADVAIVDLELPDARGATVVQTLATQFPSVPLIVLTGLDSDEIGLRTTIAGAEDFLVKGRTDAATLIRTLRHAIARHELQQRLRDSERRYRALFELNRGVICTHTLDGILLSINAAGAELLDCLAGEIVGHDLREFVAPDSRAEFNAYLAHVAAESQATGALTLQRASGRLFSVDYRSRLCRDPDEPPYVLMSANDITPLRRALAAFEVSEKRFRDLFSLSRGLICTHDLDGILLSVNPAALEALGYSAADMLGLPLTHFVPDEHIAQIDAYIRRVRERGSDSGTLPIRTQSGAVRYWEYNNKLLEESGSEPYVMGHGIDITERMQLERRLRGLTLRDPLTGAYNRRFLDEFEAAADADQVWGCIVIDLDHFKSINDRDGHLRGDEVLIETAKLLGERARGSDMIVRMGGDEFLVLLPRCDADALSRVATRLSEIAPNAPCTLSIGYALRSEGERLDRTVARADDELYRRRLAVRQVT